MLSVGRIDKDTLPNGKIKTILSGSKANSVSPNNSISQNPEKSTENSGKIPDMMVKLRERPGRVASPPQESPSFLSLSAPPFSLRIPRPRVCTLESRLLASVLFYIVIFIFVFIFLFIFILCACG